MQSGLKTTLGLAVPGRDHKRATRYPGSAGGRNTVRVCTLADADNVVNLAKFRDGEASCEPSHYSWKAPLTAKQDRMETMATMSPRRQRPSEVAGFRCCLAEPGRILSHDE